jgi:hypothetical protein
MPPESPKRDEFVRPAPKPFLPGRFHAELFANAEVGRVVVVEKTRWKIDSLTKEEPFTDRDGNARARHDMVLVGIEQGNLGRKISMPTDDEKITDFEPLPSSEK